MSDLPQGLRQQSHARPISGEELEVLGKKAAALWSEGRVSTLSDAVVETVKHARLAPEQVRRVVEFANHDAYLREFRRDGLSHKVIDFGNGGPADPGEVLKDLNDGGGGSVFDSGMGDYNSPPAEKKASVDDAVFFGATKDAPLPYAEPLTEALDLKSKLAGAADSLTADLTELESQFSMIRDGLYHEVKQASMEGVSLGEVLQAWQVVPVDPYFVKAAFAFIGPKLVSDGVFAQETLQQSIEKTGSAKLVNHEHPIVQGYTEFCETLAKLAMIRATKEEVETSLEQLTGFISKVANAGGIVGKARALGDVVTPYAEGAGKLLGQLAVGKGEAANTVGKVVGSGVGGAVTYAPHAAGALLALKGYRKAQQLRQTPLAYSVLKEVPLTQEHLMTYGY